MTNDPATRTGEPIISLTPDAVAEVKRLLAEEDQKDLFLRLGVTAGGCSGFSYAISFDNQPGDFDREFDFDGLKVRIDLKALMHMAGATLDYKGGLSGGFAFSNPKAKRSCGCGSSFSC